MEQPPQSDPAPAGELQFDRADFGEQAPAGTLQCSLCQETVADTYYEINGEVVCEGCQTRAQAIRTGGSAWVRVGVATLFGTLAGALGAGIYYGISALTGYEFGLIAILVGFMVGFAVNFGSQQRGGWFYQLLAVGLTYCSIVSTYVPPIAEELRLVSMEEVGEAAAAEAGTEPGLPAAEPAAGGRSEIVLAPAESEGLFGEEPEGLFAAEAEPAEDSEPPPARVAEPAPVEGAEPTAPPGDAVPGVTPPAEELEVVEIPAVFFWLVVVAFAFVAPFLGGFSNILGILIIGFGLYQAWQLNRKRPFEVTGPFQVAGVGG